MKTTKKITIVAFLLVCFALLAFNGSALTISEPRTGYTYRDSVINLNYSTELTGTINCYYAFDNQSNVSISDCENTSIEAPINNGSLNLTVWEVNATTTLSDTVTISVNNELTEGKALLIGFIMLLFLALPFVFWIPAFQLEKTHTPIKLFLALLGFFSGLIFLSVGQIVTNSYIHSAALDGALTAFITGYRWIFYVIMAYFVFALIFHILNWWGGRKDG